MSTPSYHEFKIVGPVAGQGNEAALQRTPSLIPRMWSPLAKTPSGCHDPKKLLSFLN